MADVRQPSVIGLALLVLAGCAVTPPQRPPASATAAADGSSSEMSAWPPAMNNPAATWDAGSGLTLVAGDTGRADGLELWGWDGAHWRQLDDGQSAAPFARDDAHLVADPARGVVWLLGGRTQRGGHTVAHSDTWQWDGAAWSVVSGDGAAAAPPPRLHPSVAWDEGSQQVVLYGGIGVGDSDFGDTWAWNGAAWTERQLSAPAGRQAPVGMAWDAATGQLALMTVDLLEDPPDGLYAGRLWIAGNDAWAARDGSTPTFSPIQALVGTGDGLALVDGGLLQGNSATWTWDGATWTRAPGAGFSPRNGHAVAYDAARGRLVLFGGYDGVRDTAELWEWDGTVWRQFAAP
jgi:hypothetical protein